MANQHQRTFDVLPGHKFAILAVSDCRAGPSPSAVADLGKGYAMSRVLPSGALKTWATQLGSIHESELRKCNLFLWATAPSDSPGILDGENNALQRRVYQLYLGLLIAMPYLRHGRLTSLTGSNIRGEAGVRSLTWYSGTYYTIGSPRAPLTIQRARDAAAIASALATHSSQPGHRMVRALRTFRQATESPELDVRLHQFVRAIEAFIAPPFGRSAEHFADRLATVNWGRGRPVALELYKIRSAIEHLRGPYDAMPKRPAGGKSRRMARRIIEAETIARYLLFTYFSHRELWPHFLSRETVDALWVRSAPELRKALGSGIPLTKIAAAIDWNDFELRLRQ